MEIWNLIAELLLRDIHCFPEHKDKHADKVLGEYKEPEK